MNIQHESNSCLSSCPPPTLPPNRTTHFPTAQARKLNIILDASFYPNSQSVTSKYFISFTSKLSQESFHFIYSHYPCLIKALRCHLNNFLHVPLASCPTPTSTFVCVWLPDLFFFNLNLLLSFPYLLKPSMSAH